MSRSSIAMRESSVRSTHGPFDWVSITRCREGGAIQAYPDGGTMMKSTGEAGLILSLGMLMFAIRTDAATIWNGPPITFSKASGADPTQAANQDRITPQVWITRGSSRGIYNAKSESSYSNTSPADTEWAYGSTANLASLTFKSWVEWNGRIPPSMVGNDAVLHLISEDIYLDIKFTVWGSRAGNFTYTRSTPNCTYALSPLDLSNTVAAGALADITVTVLLDARSRPTSFQPWVTLSGIAPSGGTTTVSLQISPNAGAARARRSW
jgi:hypothetical protein